MGCALGTNDSPDAKITGSLNKTKDLERQVRKLLLLGPGSSGKSTLFKQIKRIHGESVQIGERNESKHVIRMNLVQGMLVLLQQAHKLYEMDSLGNNDCQINMEDIDTLNAIQQLVEFNGVTFQEADTYAGSNDDNDYDENNNSNNNHNSNTFNEQFNDALANLGANLALLWENEGVQATFSKRQGLFSFPDNLDYFFDKVEEVMQADYSPSDEDVLKVRIRTTGMITYQYDADSGQRIHIIDVGGQRNERKKWIHHFSGVTAVVFVIALNHYTAVLFEDERRNAMHEAIDLFHEIRNSKWFKGHTVILFLNKRDLFEECVASQKSLSICFSKEAGWGENADSYEEEKDQYLNERFPIWDVNKDPSAFEYDGPAMPQNDDEWSHLQHAVDYQAQWIGKVFENQTKIQTKGKTIPHVICATDQEITKTIFNQVQHEVIVANLYAGGIIGNDDNP